MPELMLSVEILCYNFTLTFAVVSACLNTAADGLELLLTLPPTTAAWDGE